MKFSTKEDVEIPIDDTFTMLSDFESFERAALRHGAEVNRADDLQQPGPGMAWKVKAELRNKMRKFDIMITDYDRPNLMSYDLNSKNMRGAFLVELVALSRNRTRVRVELDVRPKTLSARLIMQSAKLARNTLNRRYKNRVAHFASDLEDRYKRGTKA